MTRPLYWQPRTSQGNSSLFYTHDGNKNVSEAVFYQRARGVAAHDEYAPFGEVTAQTRSNAWGTLDLAADNPWRFSCEYEYEGIQCVGYNFRIYNTECSQWTTREPIGEIMASNLYSFNENEAMAKTDSLGLLSYVAESGCSPKCDSEVQEIISALVAAKLTATSNVQAILEEVRKGGWPRKTNGWNDHWSVVERIKMIKTYIANGTTRVNCCPTSQGCVNARMKDGSLPAATYVKTDIENVKGGSKLMVDDSSSLVKGGTIYLCNQAKIEELGGCGCAILHELIHRSGLFADEIEYDAKNFRKDKAVVKISQILVKGTKLRCKGYGE